MSFSPGSHAEQLKILKQSPGNFYQRQSRPMFDPTQPADEQEVIFYFIYDQLFLF